MWFIHMWMSRTHIIKSLCDMCVAHMRHTRHACSDTHMRHTQVTEWHTHMRHTHITGHFTTCSWHARISHINTNSYVWGIPSCMYHPVCANLCLCEFVFMWICVYVWDTCVPRNTHTMWYTHETNSYVWDIRIGWYTHEGMSIYVCYV